MISVPTQVSIIDNTHVKLVKCLKILRKRYGLIGTRAVALIMQMGKHKKLKVGQIHRMVFIRTKKNTFNLDGSFFQFQDNAAILLKNPEKEHGKTLIKSFGHRIKGPLPLRFRKNNYIKIFSEKNEFIF